MSHARVWSPMLRAILISLLVAAGARADSASDEARAAYDAGSSEYDLGHYREALLDFEKAFKLRHVPALLFNIAQCHRMMGEMKEAATVYKSFIAKDPNNARLEQARTLLEQVEAALASQSEAQTAKPTEVTARQDAPADVPRARAEPLPARVEPSPARAAPPAKTAQPAAEELALVEARRPGPAAAPTRAIEARRVEAPAAAQASHRRVLTWVAGGGAVAATGLGLVLGARSKSTQSSLQGSLHPGAEVKGLQQDQVADAHRANALFVAGAVLAALGVTFFVLEF